MAFRAAALSCLALRERVKAFLALGKIGGVKRLRLLAGQRRAAIGGLSLGRARALEGAEPPGQLLHGEGAVYGGGFDREAGLGIGDDEPCAAAL